MTLDSDPAIILRYAALFIPCLEAFPTGWEFCYAGATIARALAGHASRLAMFGTLDPDEEKTKSESVAYLDRMAGYLRHVSRLEHEALDARDRGRHLEIIMHTASVALIQSSLAVGEARNRHLDESWHLVQFGQASSGWLPVQIAALASDLMPLAVFPREIDSFLLERWFDWLLEDRRRAFAIEGISSWVVESMPIEVEYESGFLERLRSALDAALEEPDRPCVYVIAPGLHTQIADAVVALCSDAYVLDDLVRFDRWAELVNRRIDREMFRQHGIRIASMRLALDDNVADPGIEGLLSDPPTGVYAYESIDPRYVAELLLSAAFVAEKQHADTLFDRVYERLLLIRATA